MQALCASPTYAPGAAGAGAAAGGGAGGEAPAAALLQSRAALTTAEPTAPGLRDASPRHSPPQRARAATAAGSGALSPIVVGRRASRDELQVGKLADAAARDSASRAAHHQLPQLPPSLTQLPPPDQRCSGGKGAAAAAPSPCCGGKGGKGTGFPRRRALCDSPQRQLAAAPPGSVLGGGGAPSAAAPSAAAPSAAPSAHGGRGGGRAQHAPAATRDAPPPPRDAAAGLGAAASEVVPLSALRIDTGLATACGLLEAGEVGGDHRGAMPYPPTPGTQKLLSRCALQASAVRSK